MKNILIIDDDNLVRGMVAKALRKTGYHVLEASDGNEGLQVALHHSVDIVITDILMPDKEGIETILELKDINEKIKIIAMSGGGKRQNMTFLNMAKKAGADKLLKKPFRPSELIQLIEEL